MGGCIEELEVEHGRHRATLKRLALVNDELASIRADAELAESAREALNHAIENFKNSEELKEEILEGGFVSYCIRYEDRRDTVGKLYPNLDLSSIIPPISKDRAAEDDAASIEDTAPTALEDVPIVDATLEQGDRGND